MARIILSQNIDKPTNYRDIPFQRYHFPKRYINQLSEGDEFIYYQGDRYKKEHRYYFGTGVIGKIYPDEIGEGFYCDILNGTKLANTVPIYHGDARYIECLGFSEIRDKENPPWQSSIRPVSREAFVRILELGNVPVDVNSEPLAIECPDETDKLAALKRLNQKYAEHSPDTKAKLVYSHVDRGAAITKELKNILGAKCQVCGHEGFEKCNGDRYIEAHHIIQVADQAEGSLCSGNIALVCPNCHREIHYGRHFSAIADGDWIEITLSSGTYRVRRNTLEYLESLS